MNTKIKICGMTNVSNALFAAELGADMIGFIFVPSSPRYVTPAQAAEIVCQLPENVTPVGVFANESETRIRSIMQRTGIRMLQLHGNESPEECARYSGDVIKAFHVKVGFDPSVLKQYPTSLFLLDTFSSQALGGTGKTFNWDIAVEAKKYGNIMLAGGLNPENISEAITRVHPYGVDINSGVESSPGKKDHAKLKALFEQIRKKELA